MIGILGMPDEEAPFFSIIVDGIHSHPYAVRFAQKAHGSKCVLITDAVPAMGLPDGHYTLGKQKVLVANKWAWRDRSSVGGRWWRTTRRHWRARS